MLSLTRAVEQLRADLQGRQGPIAHRGRRITPALRWRLRLVAWNAALSVDPFIADADVIRASVGTVRDDQPIDRRLTIARIQARLRASQPSPDEIEEALAAATAIYPLDSVRAISLVDAAKPHLQTAAPSLRTALGATLAGFDLTVACHTNMNEPEVRRRFKKLMDVTMTEPGSGVRLGGVLDFSTYLGNQAPDRAYESIGYLRGLRIEINAAPPDIRESLRRYFSLRIATAMTTVGASVGDRKWLDHASRELGSLEAESDLPPATALDLARNLTSIDAARALLLDKEGRFDVAERAAESGVRRLQHAREVAEPLMSVPQGTEPWYRQRNLVTGGYRPGVRHLLNELDLRIWLGDEVAVQVLLMSAAAAWNDDPAIGIFYDAIQMVALRAAEEYGIDLPDLAPPVLGNRLNETRPTAHLELTPLTRHRHTRIAGISRRARL